MNYHPRRRYSRALCTLTGEGQEAFHQKRGFRCEVKSASRMYMDCLRRMHRPGLRAMGYVYQPDGHPTGGESVGGFR